MHRQTAKLPERNNMTQTLHVQKAPAITVDNVLDR